MPDRKDDIMRVILNPERSEWANLAMRPVMETDVILPAVRSVLEDVRQNGDTAVRKYTLEFDGISVNDIRREVRSDVSIDPELKAALQTAKQNIEAFHKTQSEQSVRIQTMHGVECWRKSVPIEKVGLYIPGGTAPLFSTLLMLAIPAQIAGCKEIVVCTPPTSDGELHPVIEYTASILGIDNIYLAGGSQAIAAMAFGTETIPRIYKIFGPGNQYVTAAKQLVQQYSTAIDMPAGPSEVLVIADEYSNPEFVAADLLSQAEHGSDSQVVLVSDSRETVQKCIESVTRQLSELPREKTAQLAIDNSFAVVFDDLADGVDFSNLYAPEHLIINCTKAESLAEKITNAGSVFIGQWSCESLGDYASGTNHTLPTNGFAVNYSGVSVDSFIKKITFQQISEAGIQQLGPVVETLAEAENLRAHRMAVTVRLNSIS